MSNLSAEQEWYFYTLSILSAHIGSTWATIMKVDKEDPTSVSWYVVPCEGKPFDEIDDLSFAEKHADRVLIKERDGILFAHPSKTPKSIWMSVQLKDQPELAGRII